MNYLSALTVFIAVTTFFSCSSESVSMRNEDSGDINPCILFAIGTPKGDAFTYDIQDAAESKIKSLYLYKFDSDKKLIADPISINVESDLIKTSTGCTYQEDIDPTQKGEYYFFLVANEAPSDQMTVGKTIDDLQAIVMHKALADNTSCATLLNDEAFPMTGVATKFGNERIPLTNDGVAIQVILRRVFARLDIKNNMEGLVINDIKVVTANDQSYLFPREEDESILVPTAIKNEIKILPFTPITTPLNKGDEMTKAFYLYEGNQSSKEEAVHVEITGKLGGVNVLYSIPFWKDSEGDEVGQEIPIQRNHLYHLFLGDGSEKMPDVHADASFMLIDKEWNEQTVMEAFEIISATYNSVEGTTYDIQKHELNIDNSASSNLTFDLSTLYTNHTKFTATITGTPAWITATIIDNKLTIHVTENTTGVPVPRDAEIKVFSDASPSTTYTILIKQGYTLL